MKEDSGLPWTITYKVNVGGKSKPRQLLSSLVYEDWKDAIMTTPGLPDPEDFEPELTWKLASAPKVQDL